MAIKQVALSVGATRSVPTGSGMPSMRRHRDLSRVRTNTRPLKNALQVSSTVDSPSVAIPISVRQPRPAPHIMLGWERKF